VHGASGGAQLGGNGVALGDDGSGFGGGHSSAVEVAELVVLAAAPAGGNAGEQGGGDVAQRRDVVFAGSSLYQVGSVIK
jgi:hypothetical protein